FLHDVLVGTATYGTIELRPSLMLPRDLSEGLRPVKTVPSHFSPVYDADENDFTRVFGQEDATHFEIGRPLDMDVPVCIDLIRLVERSNGVFGKSGTGKSFLTRLLLSGTIKAGVAANLIFDMHSEYASDASSEGGGFVKGLRKIFGPSVRIYTLDAESTNRRGAQYDQEIRIGLNEIEVEDILLLQDELNLNATAAESAYRISDRFGDGWLKALLDMSPEAIQQFADETGTHYGSLSALKRKLEMLKRRGYVADQTNGSVINTLIDELLAKHHVVLEFGRFDNTIDYMLVANIITRKIHAKWRERTEKYLTSKDKADKPTQLVITIEEAHKFLNPAAAKQTIFGTIAREMRKYSVTLLVVDQRPSSIDSDVMSQLGSRITSLLNDEKDIDAVFTGVSGSNALRTVLATLDSKQQCLILGHAVPMPVVVRTRPYDEIFYQAMMNSYVAPTATDGTSTPAPRLASVEDLFAED
ncbi:MAG: ATP-binding protein, partial [Chloroflexales bacterium]|nr:ATP-binding protein [Chloroflexales bacterium]